MKQLLFFIALWCCTFAFSSCNQDSFDEQVSPESSQLINKSGKVDGLSYALNQVAINPDVVSLSAENSSLLSSPEELEKGILKVQSAHDFQVQELLYISMNNYTSFKRVESVSLIEEGVYQMNTTPAQLGELFQKGDISLSLDLYEASKAQLSSKAGFEFDKVYEILNLNEEYVLADNVSYNPGIKLNMGLYLNIAFDKAQSLPSSVTTYFEILPNINPLFTFAGSLNKEFNRDLIEFVPSQLIELLKQQEFKIDLPINAYGIATLPATIKMEDIKLPTHIKASSSSDLHWNYNISGACKIGYHIEIDGFHATPAPIYENSLTIVSPSPANWSGELLTKADVVITPKITVLDDFYNISGDIAFGVATETIAETTIDKTPAFASKGIFTSKMSVLVDLLFAQVPVEIINEEKELWNIGELEKTLTYSDLSWQVSSKYTPDIMTLSRLYETDFTVHYKYSTAGKKIPNKLLVSYDVYQDNGTTKILSQIDLPIETTKVTDNSFSFKLNIPFRSRLFGCQGTSYLKNLVINDQSGYANEGILSSQTGTVENEFVINR